MANRIAVAGSTGSLGTRIVKSLATRGAAVVALVREDTKPEKIETLNAIGATVESLDFSSRDQIARACDWLRCVSRAEAIKRRH